MAVINRMRLIDWLTLKKYNNLKDHFVNRKRETKSLNH